MQIQTFRNHLNYQISTTKYKQTMHKEHSKHNKAYLSIQEHTLPNIESIHTAPQLQNRSTLQECLKIAVCALILKYPGIWASSFLSFTTVVKLNSIFHHHWDLNYFLEWSVHIRSCQLANHGVSHIGDW